MEFFIKIVEFLFFGLIIINPIFWVIRLKKRNPTFYFLITSFSLFAIIWIGAWCDDMLLIEHIYYKINKPIAAIGVVIITFPYTIIVYIINRILIDKMKKEKNKISQ